MHTETIIMFIWSIIQLPVSIFCTWKISKWYHNKKSNSDQIFESVRNEKLEELKSRTGQSYSIFEEKCRHIINKKTIFEQDLASFSSSIDIENLSKTLRHNQKNVSEKQEEYSRWINHDEFWHHVDFFRIMLWFLGELQEKSINEFSMERIHNLHKQIKIQSKEYLEYSHIISFTSTITYEDGRRLHGKKYFKASI